MPERIWEPFKNIDRFYLAIVSSGCVGLFYTVARLLAWPHYLKYEASLLASSSPAAAIGAVVVGMLLALVLGTLLLGKLRYEAGLFAACIGLAALANRGGTVGSLLRTVGQPRVYLTMLMEMVMLLGVMMLSWQLLGALCRRGWLEPEGLLTEQQAAPAIERHVLATGVQALVTALMLVLLVQVDNKKQVAASIVIASLVGSLVAHQAVPVRRSIVYWTGPFLVGMAGYLWALKSPGHWSVGSPANPLAAASPLDYASLGTAGAIFGYWMSRQWEEAAVEIDLPENVLD